MWFYSSFQGLQGPCGSVDKPLGTRNPWLKAAACTKLDMSGHVKGYQKSCKITQVVIGRTGSKFLASSHICIFYVLCFSWGDAPAPSENPCWQLRCHCLCGMFPHLPGGRLEHHLRDPQSTTPPPLTALTEPCLCASIFVFPSRLWDA